MTLYPVLGVLGLAAVERIATAARSGLLPAVVLASVIGAKLRAALVARGLGFLDLAGNCHLELDGGNVTVQVEGRHAVRPSGVGSLRAAGYRVMFTLLAAPRLLERTVRDIGGAANVSRHAVQSLMARLRDEGVLIRAGRSKHLFAPGGREKCIDRFDAGWADVLRGNLLAGRFRMREQEPGAVAQRIAQCLGAAKVQFGFGGARGSSRWLRYLDSGETTIHVAAWGAELARALGAVPDRQGPLHVFRTMTTLDLESGEAETAHPLLIHAELARSPDPRARETAGLLLDRIASEES
ncbi:MAG: hypothetical protein KDC98_14670 [Planctomycetes bacterium]|nr:hypothetical protein [Planctomycetota bacterium]